MNITVSVQIETQLEPADLQVEVVAEEQGGINTRGIWKDTRPPMSPQFHNRHEEYVASGNCPAEWYGVL